MCVACVRRRSNLPDINSDVLWFLLHYLWWPFIIHLSSLGWQLSIKSMNLMRAERWEKTSMIWLIIFDGFSSSHHSAFFIPKHIRYALIFDIELILRKRWLSDMPSISPNLFKQNINFYKIMDMNGISDWMRWRFVPIESRIEIARINSENRVRTLNAVCQWIYSDLFAIWMAFLFGWEWKTNEKYTLSSRIPCRADLLSIFQANKFKWNNYYDSKSVRA